jgi:hypothetical protein
MLYALHCVFAKTPKLVGVLRFYSDRLRNKPNRIIEHKEPRQEVALARASSG